MEVLKRLSNGYERGRKVLSLVDFPSADRSVRDPLPRQRHHRLTAAERAAVVAAHQSGALIRELAERFGVNRKTISKTLERHGVARRYRLLSVEDLPGIRAAYAAGASLEELGRRFKVDASTVRRFMLKHGVGTRPRTGQ